MKINRIKTAVIVMVGVLFWAQSGAAQSASQAVQQQPVQSAPSFDMERGDHVYRIAPENLLQIRILGEAGLQQTYRVDDQGFITHPLAGRIKLAGQTVHEAEEMLETMLKGDYIRNPHITIFVVEHSRFSILGEVRSPGSYEIIGEISLVEAISMAGGFTPLSNQKKVRILRKTELGEEETIEADIAAIMEGKAKDIYVEAEDVISVPKSFF